MQDVAKLVEQYLTEDATRWAKLASDVRWRRLQVLLLRDILVELRQLNDSLRERSQDQPGAMGDAPSGA